MGNNLRFRSRAATAPDVPFIPWRPNLVDIPGLLFWFDPTDPAKMSVDGNGGIDLFIPQVGDTGLYTMTQLAEINRPLSVPGPNGKTVVGFPSAPPDNRWLERANAPVDFSLGVSIVVAWLVLDVADGHGICSQRSSSPNARLDLSTNTASQILYRYGDFLDLGQGTRPIVPNEWYISTTRDREWWLNGGTQMALAQGSLAGVTSVLQEFGHQAGGVPFAGGIGHWLVIQGPVTDETLRKIEGFVAWDLGLESSLVPGHPWKDQRP